MNSLNKVTLVGNLRADPKIVDSIKGSRFVMFSLATHESWKDKEGDMQKETEWQDVVVFNEHFVTFIESSLEKSDLVYLEGQLKSREWISEEGQKRTAVEIVLSWFGGDLKHFSIKTSTQEKGEDPRDQRKVANGN